MRFCRLGAGVIALVATGCTESNPGFVAALDGGSAPDFARAIDLAGADLVGIDLAMMLVEDLALPPPVDDLSVPPDLSAYGPSIDVAENVEATWDVGESTDDNVEPCNPVNRGHVSIAGDAMKVMVGMVSAKVSYGPDQAEYFQAVYPKARNAGWDLTTRTGLHLFIDGQQPMNYGGWDPPAPTLVLCGQGGYRRLDPMKNVLPTDGAGWVELMVPLAGDGTWTMQDNGNFSLAEVDWIELHTDPLRNNGTGTCNVWYDDVRFY